MGIPKILTANDVRRVKDSQMLTLFPDCATSEVDAAYYLGYYAGLMDLQNALIRYIEGNEEEDE